ncbi:polysaccharide deacetylase family protein [Alicyclobacillus fastidiosus]|uniref:Polysaccharide deacetylase family protein n=1 Tax=Alicyclobacillus fastidiosus TaxID=392011 RepID=A0ABV5AH86_9BACL|nr:polysaccharide deacetylase family protein [Alicyclobacillus fastidiosus]WEH07884.1 polysaccharide deacetylase family protein [Alicyclobacillus fastidiosus]
MKRLHNMRTALAALSVIGLFGSYSAFGSDARSATVSQQAQALHKLDQYGEEMSTKPVDARIDRVWHLVPGLEGWTLDTGASRIATKASSDGKLHLVWKPVRPAVSAASLQAEPIYRGPSTEKSVALMVNVSWGEEYVPALLKTFKKYGVHATFFLDGQWVKAHPDLARQIEREGHAIGSHGTGHPDFRRLSDGKLVGQLEETNATIERVTGKPVRIIAPPAGAYDERLVTLAKERGMYTILWTADTVDWRRPPAEQIVARAKRGLTPGCLLLMHPTKPTVQALPQILKLIETSGYHAKTVEDVVFERPAVKPPSVLSVMD